ncbi:hypothetical protein [Nocardiopsis sp. NRRL B-16309]|uniref:hypothetical protein n=1 Tax=Nocardiopsis sp. NRRL B-16309 TaxID=1519494 RepID=UPI000ACC9D0F|nr:hypothetical protein [Nocardiopsis sp. NRRL B-16309]
MYGRAEGEWEELIEETVTFLEEQSRLERLTSYTELNSVLVRRTGQRAFDFSSDADRAAMGHLLGAAVERTRSEVQAMISAIVVYLNANDAGTGFYKLASELGELSPNPSSAQKEAFWAGQVKKVHSYYASH